MNRTWINPGETLVACDGRKVVVLRNDGTADAPSLSVECEYARRDPAGRPAGDDPTGRVVPLDGLRAAAHRLAPRDVAEAAFLRCVIVGLDEAVLAGDIRSLMIVAPPRALAMIRRHAPPSLRAVIRREIEDDLVDSPVADLEERFRCGRPDHLAAIA